VPSKKSFARGRQPLTASLDIPAWFMPTETANCRRDARLVQDSALRAAYRPHDGGRGSPLAGRQTEPVPVLHRLLEPDRTEHDKEGTMDPLKVSAQFAAYIWASHGNLETEQVQDRAARFARENWTAFLRVAPEGLGRLLLQIAAGRKVGLTGRSRRRIARVRQARLLRRSTVG
jgi:hypothetical protein